MVSLILTACLKSEAQGLVEAAGSRAPEEELERETPARTAHV